MKRAALFLLLLPAVALGQVTTTIIQTAPVTNAAAGNMPPARPGSAKPASASPVQFDEAGGVNSTVIKTSPAGAPSSLNVKVGAGAVIQFKRPVINHIGAMRGFTSPMAQPVSDQSSGPMLYWKNGESVGGDLAGGSADELSWKSWLFDDPLEMKWDAIDRIEWPGTALEPDGAFGVVLRDGSFIYGDLVSATDTAITLHTGHHGDVVLKSTEVIRAQRLRHASLLFAGPTGDVNWSSFMVQEGGNLVHSSFGVETPSTLSTGPGGALNLNIWNRCALLNQVMPPSVDVEFRLHSSQRPAFSVALGGNLTEPLRIETWDDDLVLVLKTRFKPIRKIAPDEREIALRVCWDAPNKKCAVYTPNGELVTEWDVTGDPSHDSGFVIENKGKDLTVDLLKIRAWNGQPPRKTDAQLPRVELADGRSVSGAILPSVSGSLTVQGSAGPVSYPIDTVDALVFSKDLPRPATTGVTLAYSDGEMLQGNVISMTPKEIDLATSFTSAPLPCKLADQRRLFVRSPAPKDATPLNELDKIVIQSTTLHGRFSNATGNALAWLPVGGVKPARPAAALSTEIIRALPPDTPLPPDPSLFYMASGDVVPGTLRSLDRNGAEFESSIMDAKTLPANQLNAIQFGAAARVNVTSFSDPGWHVVKGGENSAKFKDNSVELSPSCEIGYSSLMACSDIRFKYASNGFSSLRVRLFCAGPDDAHSMNILLGNTGSQFICGQESSPGQFESQTQIRVNPGQPVAIRLALHDDEVEVFLNDVSIQHFAIDNQTLSGSGLVLEPAGMWGNGAFAVTLSDFSATSGLGRTWLPDVDNDAKVQALTVPRFEKDDPPKHVLVAANGDLLRGEVEAATDTHFGFRTGLETLNVPRDRVKAVIWLKPPEPNAPAAKPASDAPNPLAFALHGRAVFGQVGVANLIGFIKSQDPSLKVDFTDWSMTHPGMIQIGDQTVGQALATICSRFGLRYHVDSDGTVVLESASDTADILPSKTYWLKPDALPAASTAQETLISKGITFGKNAYAEWHPGTGELSMTNTEENQAKLAAVVASDFGGSLGSPTHWLTLTSGGRLGLAVDDFGADFITGRSPIYGAVKIPVNEVVGIHTTPPELTPAARLLDGWRLVNAPEPVVPAPGSDDPALLGKDAFGFKLPLLEGGDFDLDAEKGNVVVLDFWATWCGPCVRSLPGLVDTLSSFPANRVKLIGVNQGEAPDVVKHFLEAKNIKFPVALDADQNVARKYGVDAIPHTVIVGPDGKIAWVQTGYDPDGDSAVSDTIKHLLAPSATKPPASPTPQ